MPNGNELISDMEFEELLQKKSSRPLIEFIARQQLQQSRNVREIREEVMCNKTRSIVNRFALIALVLVLIALGVLSTEWLSLF